MVADGSRITEFHYIVECTMLVVQCSSSWCCVQVLRAPAASVLAVLTGDSEYSFLVELINIARLNDLLQQLPAITFFAPTNQVT